MENKKLIIICITIIIAIGIICGTIIHIQHENNKTQNNNTTLNNTNNTTNNNTTLNNTNNNNTTKNTTTTKQKQTKKTTKKQSSDNKADKYNKDYTDKAHGDVIYVDGQKMVRVRYDKDTVYNDKGEYTGEIYADAP